MALLAACYFQYLMAAPFYTATASGTIVVNNADNLSFRTFIPEITENKNKRK
jgi:hypothetical protein